MINQGTPRGHEIWWGLSPLRRLMGAISSERGRGEMCIVRLAGNIKKARVPRIRIYSQKSRVKARFFSKMNHFARHLTRLLKKFEIYVL